MGKAIRLVMRGPTFYHIFMDKALSNVYNNTELRSRCD